MTNGPIERSKSEALFKRRSKNANKKIKAISAATSKGKIAPIGKATKTAAEIIKAKHEKLIKSSAPAWRKARRNKMSRKDI